MSYFTAVIAKESRKGRTWSAHDVDVDSVKDLGELADELRIIAEDDQPVLFLIEREDAWWGVVRVDGEEDPRVFVSDAGGAAASTYAELLDAEVDEDDELTVISGACAGDFDVLTDLGTPPETLREMCEEEVPPMDALASVAEGAGFAEVLDSLR